MDDKGLAYTLDAVLAQIPVIIVIFRVSNFMASVEPAHPVHSSQNAQDILELMSYSEVNHISVLEKISLILSSGNNSRASITDAQKIASSFLDEKLAGNDYLLTEENQLRGEILAGKMDLKKEDNLATASMNCGNYTFRIYIK